MNKSVFHRAFAGRHGGLSDVSELWFVDASKVRPERLALGDTSATLRELGLEPTVEAHTFNVPGLVDSITRAP